MLREGLVNAKNSPMPRGAIPTQISLGLRVHSELPAPAPGIQDQTRALCSTAEPCILSLGNPEASKGSGAALTPLEDVFTGLHSMAATFPRVQNSFIHMYRLPP